MKITTIHGEDCVLIDMELMLVKHQGGELQVRLTIINIDHFEGTSATTFFPAIHFPRKSSYVNCQVK